MEKSFKIKLGGAPPPWPLHFSSISENISEVCVKAEPALGFPIGISL